MLNNEGWNFDFVGSQSDGTGFDTDHEGHGGWRTDQINANINNWLNQYDPDIVLLHIGTNDVSQEKPNSTTVDYIENILTKIHNYDSKSIILLCKLIPRIGDRYQQNEDLNVLIGQLYQQKKNQGFNIYLADQNTAFKNNSNWQNDYLADNVHPSHSGYAVMANKFLSVLRSVKFWLSVLSNPSGSGAVQLNPDKTKFSYNESVTLTAQANGGYQFDHWSGDISNDNVNPRTIQMWKSRTITANFSGGASETVSTPTTPSGPSSGQINSNLSYTTGGAASSLGHSIEYQFSWGDGNESSWGGASRSHSYSSGGTYQIRSRARCTTHTNIVSNWSGSRSVTIDSPTETYTLTVSVTPAAAGSVDKSPNKGSYENNESVSLTANPANSSYQFSYWSGDLSGNQNPKNITMNADKNVKAHFNVETVSAPNRPSGVSEGLAGADLDFTVGGATSNFGHSVEYQFDFGDGSQSSWGSSTRSYTYTNTGTFQIKARARCSSHTSILSGWSDQLSIKITGLVLTINVQPESAGSVFINPNKDEYNYLELVRLTATPADGSFRFDSWSGDIQTNSHNPRGITMKRNRTITANFIGETVTVPNTPVGPLFGSSETELLFSTGGSVSNFGHEVEYQLDWGDGVISNWGLNSQNHIYHSVGTKLVKARARCLAHQHVVSEWSEVFNLTVADYTLTITIDPAGSGSVAINPDKGNYIAGESVEITAQGAPGYSFDHWSGDFSGAANPNTITMNKNIAAIAHFLLTYEIVSKPIILTGPDDGIMGQSLSFATGGASSNFGSEVEYQFDWGDSSKSDWADSTQPHSYLTTGEKLIKARARSMSDTTILSEWSDTKAINISGFELSVIINPDSTGKVNINPQLSEYADSAEVQLFAAADSGFAFSHWSGAISGDENPTTIIMSENKEIKANFEIKLETVSTPDAPVGPVNATIGQQLTFFATGAVNNYNFELEYQFDWGDRTVSTWGINERSHIYFSSDTFKVKVRAHSKKHPDVMSNWSETHAIVLVSYTLTIITDPHGKGLIASNPNKFEYSDQDTVELWAVGVPGFSFDYWSGAITGNMNPGKVVMNRNKEIIAHFVANSETLSSPHTPQGAADAYRGQILTYTTIVSESNGWGDVNYQFNWGDSSLSDWGDSSQTHIFLVSGNYSISSRARSVSDTSVISPWSDTKSVSITGCKLIVNTEPENSGKVVKNPPALDYDYGSVVTLTSVDELDFKFVHWNEDLNDTSRTKIVVLTGDTTIIAVFTPSAQVKQHLGETPQKFVLKQNYPNPFNPQTRIDYQLAKNCKVQIGIYNVTGQLIRVLVDEEQSAGWYSIMWNALNGHGLKVPSGVYLYHIKTDYFEQVHKMILMK